MEGHDCCNTCPALATVANASNYLSRRQFYAPRRDHRSRPISRCLSVPIAETGVHDPDTFMPTNIQIKDASEWIPIKFTWFAASMYHSSGHWHRSICWDSNMVLGKHRSQPDRLPNRPHTHSRWHPTNAIISAILWPCPAFSSIPMHPTASAYSRTKGVYSPARSVAAVQLQSTQLLCPRWMFHNRKFVRHLLRVDIWTGDADCWQVRCACRCNWQEIPKKNKKWDWDQFRGTVV